MPVIAIASVRNCQMMSRRRAPMARRMPISRVRSLTDASITFITPTPPTMKATVESANITARVAKVILSKVSVIVSLVLISKSLGANQVTWRRRRISSSTSSIARCNWPCFERMAMLIPNQSQGNICLKTK